MTNQEAAHRLWTLGWNVIAAPLQQKAPASSWRRWQTERVPERQIALGFSHGERNLFVVTGAISGLLVLDCDTEEALAYWQAEIGDELEQTAQADTGKGRHFYFRLPPGTAECRSWSGPGFDVQADKKGVIAPPSVHPSGRRYEWRPERGPESIREAPGALLRGPAGLPPSVSGGTQEAPRSTFRQLLNHPPAEGGRNAWLTRVAGHYATRFKERDLLDHHVRWAASTMPVPLADDEIAKITDSIYATELAKYPATTDDDGTWRLVTPTQDTGWLVSGGDRLLVQCRADGGYVLEQIVDADFRALGVMREEGEVTYDVQLLQAGVPPFNDRLPSSTLGDYRKLQLWLAAHRVHPMPPDRMSPRTGPLGTRLQSYLDAQKPDSFEVVPYLGWHKESAAFITHEQLIRHTGPAPHERIKPSVGRDRANYTYGFGGEEEARSVLNEVLSFHDATVTAVFGAWWAAVLIKEQLMSRVSQFPFMAIEAPSESGKSTGFFSMMLECSGAKDANMQSTKASTRDFLASHSSGITWVDDLDDTAYLMELVRGSTGGASMAKKGTDHTSQVKVKLRGALVLSGEALGLGHQKALADRSVLLSVPNPRTRMSAHDPSRPQWDDVVAMRTVHPDLTRYAGEFVRLALAYVEEHGIDIARMRRGTGRFADKQAVLRIGARILTYITRNDELTRVVDEWTGVQVDPGNENTLTMHMIPTALRSVGRKPAPEGPLPEKNQTATPVLVREDGVWFSPALLADWWYLRHRGRVSQRTETADSVIQQARALGLGSEVGRRRMRFVTGDGYGWYWWLGDELSELALERADGGAGEEQTTMQTGV